jgi:hypothetical protein
LHRILFELKTNKTKSTTMRLRSLKHIATLAALLAIAVLIGSGCSHSVSPVLHQQGPFSSISDWHKPGFANPNNPYDYLGLRHNNGLSYIAARLSTISPDTLYPTTDTLSVLFMDSVNGYCAGAGATDDSLVSHLHEMREGLTHQDSILGSPRPWGTLANNEINALLNIGDWGLSADSTIDSILSIENFAFTSLTGNDQGAVFAIASIARYSIAYWSGVDTTLWPDFAAHHHNSRAIVYSIHKANGAVPLWSWAGFGGTDGIAAGVAACATWEVGVGVTPVWAGGVALWGLGASACYTASFW